MTTSHRPLILLIASIAFFMPVAAFAYDGIWTDKYTDTTDLNYSGGGGGTSGCAVIRNGGSCPSPNPAGMPCYFVDSPCTVVNQGSTCFNTTATYACKSPLPKAFISANPVSITPGGSSVLSYSCSSNSTSASIDQGIGPIDPTLGPGSTSVSPGSTTTYTLTCTNSYGSASAGVTVAVETPLTGSCAVSPSSITTGGSATWTASPSGGNGTYTYAWSGTDGLTGTGQSVTQPYSTAGSKTASVTISSGSQSTTINCSNTLIVTDPSLTATCSVSPTSIATGGSATWTASPSGGNGVYTYSWSGTDSLVGATQSVTKPYTMAGTKTASVTVSSNGQSTTAPCSNNLTVNDLPPAPANITAACNAAGTSVTLSWPAVTGATSYYPRLGGSPIQPQCGQAGWQVWTDGTTCYPNPDGWPSTSATLPVNPGQPYSAWVHSGNALGVNWSSSASTNFTCPAPPPPPPPVPTCSLSASPTNSVPSTLTWISTNATSCTGGGFSTGGATSGTASVGTAGPYTLSCTGGGGNCSSSVNIGCGTPAGTITATPSRVRANDPTTPITVTWSATGVNTSCTMSGPGVPGGSQTVPANSCSVGTQTATIASIPAQSVYTVTCAGTVVGKAIVNVIPAFQEF